MQLKEYCASERRRHRAIAEKLALSTHTWPNCYRLSHQPSVLMLIHQIVGDFFRLRMPGEVLC